MILVLAFLWVIFVPLLLWQLMRWLPTGADKYNPLPYIIALLPLATYVMGALFLCNFGGFLLYTCCAEKVTKSLNLAQSYAKSYGYLCIAYAVLFLISLKSHTPYWFAKLRRLHESRSSRKSCKKRHQEIRVMTLNCRYGKASASEIIEITKKYHVNTLLLQELSESLVKNLEKLGIYEIFPTSCVGAQSEHNNGGFNAIFTQYSAISTCNNSVKIEAASVPRVTTCLDFGATEKVVVKFASAHPKSPMRGCAAWSNGIRALATIDSTYCVDESTSKTCDLATLTIVTGDLNSTVDHPSFRSLLKYGFTDVALSLGKRLRTWPTWLKWPNLTLDHVLFCAKNCKSNALWQKNVVVDGTDHLAYIAAIDLQSLDKNVQARRHNR
ncbi:endonuclease/exonuclease/phosphatase family protein [Gardnerella leopoldii]|uniref:endonuclease/exonuclease/phosphatase family protein n=1 Tax=Gardnerella TaxID=2701 RepID=UPI0015727AD2|nr:endonuclease/exonuclease/phosphatase family protein [Gardnerella vaginalis]NSX44860.1 endonuclease/exonuclease/phosphatase family protein [Gardnerella vaginalis]